MKFRHVVDMCCVLCALGAGALGGFKRIWLWLGEPGDTGMGRIHLRGYFVGEIKKVYTQNNSMICVV